jgi:hypothetical protein
MQEERSKPSDVIQPPNIQIQKPGPTDNLLSQVPLPASDLERWVDRKVVAISQPNERALFPSIQILFFNVLHSEDLLFICA